jgi:hypothetical protein
VRVEAGKRYLVDAAGNPFFVNGDTPWSLITQLTREQTDQYLEDRRQKGINAILVELIEHEFSTNPPRNVYGDAPFTTPGDFSTPNERYFAHADYVINKAAEKGILVMLTPAYAGYGGGSQGWYQEMQANGTTKLRAYGQYVGNRYKGFANILWVQGGDYNVANKDLVRAIANGIRDFDSKPHTYHGSRGTAALQFWGTSEPWLNVNNIYTDGTTVVSAAFTEYSRSTLPFFLIEAAYEGEGIDGHGVRVQAYQAVLSGAMGHFFGNNPVWHFNAPSGQNSSGLTWQQALDSAGARSMKHLSNLFSPRSWWTLQPDTNNSFLTGGAQTGASRAVAARASDGSFAISYLPSTRPISINLGAMAGPRISARWVDPTSGASTATPGSPFLASGTQSFNPTNPNASGYGDWILLLESTQ